MGGWRVKVVFGVLVVFFSLFFLSLRYMWVGWEVLGGRTGQNGQEQKQVLEFSYRSFCWLASLCTCSCTLAIVWSRRGRYSSCTPPHTHTHPQTPNQCKHSNSQVWILEFLSSSISSSEGSSRIYSFSPQREIERDIEGQQDIHPLQKKKQTPFYWRRKIGRERERERQASGKPNLTRRANLPHPHSLISARGRRQKHLPGTKSFYHWSGTQRESRVQPRSFNHGKQNSAAIIISSSSPPAQLDIVVSHARFVPPPLNLSSTDLVTVPPVTRSPIVYRHHASATRDPAQHHLLGRLCSIAAECPEHTHHSRHPTRLSCRCYFWRVRPLWKNSV